MEGSRPLLVEVQALVSPTRARAAAARRHGHRPQPPRAGARRARPPRRRRRRQADVFVNVVGGVRVDEPGADLAVALAVASAAKRRALAGRRRPCRSPASARSGSPASCARSPTPTAARAEAAKFGLRDVVAPESAPTLRHALRSAFGRGRRRAPRDERNPVMNLEHAFTVPAGADEVWVALRDSRTIGECLPGADRTEADEVGGRGSSTGEYVAYKGAIRIEDADDAAMSPRYAASGRSRAARSSCGRRPRRAGGRGRGDAVDVDRVATAEGGEVATTAARPRRCTGDRRSFSDELLGKAVDVQQEEQAVDAARRSRPPAPRTTRNCAPTTRRRPRDVAHGRGRPREGGTGHERRRHCARPTGRRRRGRRAAGGRRGATSRGGARAGARAAPRAGAGARARAGPEPEPEPVP